MDLPTTVTPPKTRTKLPIYLVTAIVIALALIVVIINFFHRSPDDDTVVVSSTVASLGTVPWSSTVGDVGTTTIDSSESDEEEASENSTLIPVTVPSTVPPTTVPSTSTVVEEVETTVPQETTVVQETTVPPEVETTTNVEEASTVPQETTVPQQESTVTQDASTVPTVPQEQCSSTCSVSVVESIPRGVRFADTVATKNTLDSWAELIGTAKSTIDILAYKMNLRGAELRYDVDNSTFEGQRIYDMIVDKARQGLSIKLIDCQPPTMPQNDYDADELERLGFIDRRGLDINTLNGGGGGVQHSKAFIVDSRHLFVGSMNFEWKSLSQKLELGLEFHDCECIAKDGQRLFNQLFNQLSGIDMKTHELVDFKKHLIGNSSFQFLASPSFLLNSSESWDLDQLLNVIYEADEYLDIAVMQYFPSWIYFKNREFYSQIDNALRMSLSRGVTIRMLVSGDNKEEQKLMFSYLNSLQVLNSASENRKIQVRYIMIPQTAQESYKDRKMHSKFMISESSTFIGSSNYAPEYFYKSSGTAILVEEPVHQGNINKQVRAVFERYWHSHYTISLQKFGETRGFLPRITKPINPFTDWFGFNKIGIFDEKYHSKGVMLENSSEEESSEMEPIIYI